MPLGPGAFWLRDFLTVRSGSEFCESREKRSSKFLFTKTLTRYYYDRAKIRNAGCRMVILQ